MLQAERTQVETAEVVAPEPPSLAPRRSGRVPWVVWGASVALTVLGFVLYLENRAVPGAAQFFDPVLPGVALTFPGVGAMVASRRPGHRVGWLFCAAALPAVAFLAEQYAVYTLVTVPGTLPGGVWMAWIATWAWTPGYLAIPTLLLLLFPDGRPPAPGWRPVGWAVAGLIALSTVTAALAPPGAGSPALGNPLGLALPPLAGPLRALTVLVFGPLCLAGLVVRYRGAPPAERRQLRWFVRAAAAVVAVPVVAAVVSAVAGNVVPLGIYQALGLASLLGMAAAALAAIVRHRLYGLDVTVHTVVGRLVVYAVLTVVGIGAFLGAAAVLRALIPGDAGLAPSLVAVGFVAVVSHHLRPRVAHRVDRLLYRKRHYDYEVLVALGQCLQSTLGPDALLPAIVETIASALRLPYVSVTVGHGGDAAAGASYGEPRPDALTLPLLHQNEIVGRLVVAPRAPEEPFDAADRRLLDHLASQAGVAAYAMCLTADLQRSRERLVTAREEERRRLRRDLHDGLKPSLGGVTLGLEAVRNMLGDDAGGAGELLVRLRDELEAAAADLRRLVHDLRPPALDELGLVGALRQHAATFNLAPESPEVVVEAPDELVLPAAVEVAAYRIAQEAVENVRKHAGASVCTIHLAADDGHLQVEVRDDGAGLTGGHRVGVGLVGMRERAAELGGTCSVESPAGGGVRVRARLPLVPR